MNTCSWNRFTQQYDHTSPSWLKQNTQQGQNPNCISEFHCLGSSTMSRVRFMKAATGEELHLPLHICTRVRTDMPATTLEWWLRYIASLLEKPISAIRFVATTVDGDSKVISDGCSWTLLTRLQQDADGNILVQVLVVSTHVSKWKTINQKYAIGNEYMIPTKAQKLSKLTPDNLNLLRGGPPLWLRKTRQRRGGEDHSNFS